MKRLINTKLFCMLKKMNGTFNPNEQDARSAYDDFVDKVTSLYISIKGEVPTYFTLHYTRLELEGLQISLNNKGEGKKCTNPKLHRWLPIISVCCPTIRDFHSGLLFHSS